MCWKEKRYSKQGPLLVSAAWSLITLCFSIYAPVRLNFIQVARDDMFTPSVSRLHSFSPLGPGTHSLLLLMPLGILLYLENINMSFRTWVTVVSLKSGHWSPNPGQVLLLYAPSGFPYMDRSQHAAHCMLQLLVYFNVSPDEILENRDHVLFSFLASG